MKKKRKGTKRKAHRAATKPPELDLQTRMRKLLAQAASQGPPPDADEATRKKWEVRSLVDQARASLPKQAVSLGRKALDLDPDCADAWLLLADNEAETPEQAREFYEKAVAASERTLGPEAFERSEADDGEEYFSDTAEGRTHLEALLGLARVLWHFGDAEGAIARIDESLRLDPSDPLGARFFLFNYLLFTGDVDAAGRRLKRHMQMASAHWLWSRALWAFRRFGDGRNAHAALLRAYGRAPLVAEFLLGRKRLPEDVDDSFRLGSEDEAAHYVAFAEEAWRTNPKALAWLASTLPAAPAPAPDAIYQLRVVLIGSEPRIWRRLLVEARAKLSDLHDTLQVAMGWTDDHMHQFTIGDTIYQTAPPPTLLRRPVVDASRVTIASVLPRPKSVAIYEYDFGDSWEHEILVERIVEREPGTEYPVCVAGRRLGPPEDSGGIWRYDELLVALHDPDHPGYDDAIEWLGEDYDPEAFDVDEVNERF